MKVKKYDVHVHSIEDPDTEIIGKYFLCANDNFEIVTRAITNSSDCTFAKYVDNPKYNIHVITDEPISEQEIKIFEDAISKDKDPDNFFMSMKK